MKFLAAAALLVASAVAVPTEIEARTTDYRPCTSTLFSNVLCCATDALGIIGLDCEVRK